MTEALPKLVAVHGVPRSGTTWLGQLLNSSEHVAFRYQPLFSYAFRGRLSRTSSAADVASFIQGLLATDDPFVHQRQGASLAGYEIAFPKLHITHLVYKEVRFHDVLDRLLAVWPPAIGIGIVRNPCAVLHSWANAPREFREDWSLLSEWEGAPSKNSELPGNSYGFKAWCRIALQFEQLQRSFPGRFMIVRYEELIADTTVVLSDIFDRLGLPLGPQTRAFIASSRRRTDDSPYGVYRGRTFAPDRWKGNLDPSIVRAIERSLSGTTLERYLLDPGAP